MTSLTASRPLCLALLGLLPLVHLAWRRWPPPLSPGRARLSLALRLFLVSMVVLGLADVHLQRPPSRRAVVAVVDLSDSTRAGAGRQATVGAGQEDTAAAVKAMMAAKGPDDLFGVVTFGRDAQVEVPPSRRPTFDTFQTRPDGTYSDLGGALQLAANLIPDGFARQVVLLSDGRQNLGDAAGAVSSLRARSVRVDVIPVGAPPGAETLMAALDAPHVARAGESLAVTARIRSTEAATGRISLQSGGREVESRQIEIPAGSSQQTFQLPPPEPGLHRLTAVLDAQPDGYSQNDEANAVVRVLGRPKILMLEGAPGSGANVGAAMAAAGMDIETRRAKDTPSDLTVLSGYDAFVVADAPAALFPPGSMEAMATAVRNLGRGMVAVGGSRSYGPGGWENTPLEEALPVRMELPRPKERPSVAVAIAVETMETPFGDFVALGAIESVIDQLTPEDELAVVGMHHSPQLVVPLTRPVDKESIKNSIRSTQLGDPTGYGPSLGAAFAALAPSGASTKHVILMGDGDAVGGAEGYPSLMADARKAGITVSVLGVDTHFNATHMDFMRSISQLGGGTFYMSDSANEVPGILLVATRSTLRPWFEQTPFFPQISSAGDLLAGVPLDSFPELGGYVATTAKPTADVVLSSPKRDPVLAGTQYGLGRTVAWTSDAAGRWTSGFLASPVSATLFGRMVAWALPGAGGEGLAIDAVARGDGLDLTVSGPADGGDLQVQVVTPEGAVSEQQLRPVAPGRWQGLVPAGQVGTYLLHTVLRRGGALVGQAEASIPVPYSPEYLEVGREDAFLRQLARQGGALLSRPASAWAQSSLPIRVSSPVFWVLMLVVAVLWPLDVALRRLTLSPRKIWAAVQSARNKRKEAEKVLPESLDRLRQGMDARRNRPPPEVPLSTPAPAPDRPNPPAPAPARPNPPVPAPDRPNPPERQQPEAPAPVPVPARVQAQPEALAGRLLEARRSRQAAGREKDRGVEDGN